MGDTGPEKPALRTSASTVCCRVQPSCAATSGRNVALRWQCATGSAWAVHAALSNKLMKLRFVRRNRTASGER